MDTRFAGLLLAAVLLCLPAGLCQAAADPPGSRLLCALTEVIECGPLGECVELAAEDVGLPDFLRIDLEAKKIMEATSVSLRESRFTSSQTVEGVTILNGADGLRGWSAVLSAGNTKVTASISDERAAFVVFGNCRIDL